jgi:uncharacterized protein (TIGR03086 family)
MTEHRQEQPHQRLGRALSAASGLVAGVQADQWSTTTPCENWDVRALVNHIVMGNELFVGVLNGGATPTLPELLALRDADHLGPDPVSAFEQSSAALQASFAQPGALEGTYWSPMGEGPGAMLLAMRLMETLVHGWDLAIATCQPVGALPADLAQQSLGYARERMATVPRAGRFGEPQDAPDDSPAIDQLAAYLGRAPR